MKHDKTVEVSGLELTQDDFVQAMRKVRLQIVCASFAHRLRTGL
jgi:hypothetical protein